MRLEDNSTDDDDGSIKDDLVAVYDELETPKGEITGMPTGFNELDRMTAGLQKQDFIVIAARPSVGKTAFALNIAEGVAKQEQFAVGIFSLEMGRKQLLKRMISSNGRINAQHIRTSNLVDKDWGKLTGAMGDVSNLNLRIFDNPGITVNQIWAKVRKMKRDYEGKDILVIIDYLQLITGSAKHKGTMMSDIRESGQIEQDADVIGFLYRDDYYDKESESKNIIEIIIGKQRNGPIGTISLAFIKEYGVFLNLERRHDG